MVPSKCQMGNTFGDTYGDICSFDRSVQQINKCPQASFPGLKYTSQLPFFDRGWQMGLCPWRPGNSALAFDSTSIRHIARAEFFARRVFDNSEEVWLLLGAYYKVASSPFPSYCSNNKQLFFNSFQSIYFLQFKRRGATPLTSNASRIICW